MASMMTDAEADGAKPHTPADFGAPEGSGACVGPPSLPREDRRKNGFREAERLIRIFMEEKGTFTKLFRLARLPRLIKLIDITRFNKLLKSLMQNSSRDEKIVAQYMLLYIYKIFRLIVIAIIITYFIGCFWWYMGESNGRSIEERLRALVASRPALDAPSFPSPRDNPLINLPSL